MFGLFGNANKEVYVPVTQRTVYKTEEKPVLSKITLIDDDIYEYTIMAYFGNHMPKSSCDGAMDAIKNAYPSYTVVGLTGTHNYGTYIEFVGRKR